METHKWPWQTQEPLEVLKNQYALHRKLEMNISHGLLNRTFSTANQSLESVRECCNFSVITSDGFGSPIQDERDQFFMRLAQIAVLCVLSLTVVLASSSSGAIYSSSPRVWSICWWRTEDLPKMRILLWLLHESCHTSDTNCQSLMNDTCWYDPHANDGLNVFLYRLFHLGSEPVNVANNGDRTMHSTFLNPRNVWWWIFVYIFFQNTSSWRQLKQQEQRKIPDKFINPCQIVWNGEFVICFVFILAELIHVTSWNDSIIC